MNRLYTVISSTEKQSFADECRFLCEQLNKWREDKKILTVHAFVYAEDNVDFFRKQKTSFSTFRSFFPDIPFCLLNQPPADGKHLVWEVCATDTNVEVEYRKWSDLIYYTVVREGIDKMVFATGLAVNISETELNLPSVKIQSEFSFTVMASILEAEGLTFDHVIRQWNYIPELLKEVEQEEKNFQHYQIFNEIRQKYYSFYKRKKGYPAATGIGVTNGVVTIGFYAVSDSLKEKIVELTNPNQIDAYKYDQQVLVGNPLWDDEKKSPLFERGKVWIESSGITFFISGTASITGQDTVCIGDVAGQTEVTIRNIAVLMTPEAVCGKVMEFDGNKNATYLRVYIKCMEDFPIVRKICEKIYGENACINYVQADVCRKDLLVEIEGEFNLA